MTTADNKPAPKLLVIIAFGIVYLVWGSTYYFIEIAIQHIPALLMAMMRFLIAGLLLMGWCMIKKERLFDASVIKPAVISGMFLLLVGNGAVVWVEQYLPSSLVAVFAAASPIWFVLLDKRNWRINFSSRETIYGLCTGFVGVILLFSEGAIEALSGSGNSMQVIALCVLLAGSISWAAGSLYSKYHTSAASPSVNTAWQMFSAGIAFIPASLISGDWSRFHAREVTGSSWIALVYLIVMGSLAAYTAYVWLLRIRPATQVSTHAYVNPVVAVILGVFLAGEHLTALQLVGLTIILVSVLLVNLAKYRKDKPASEEAAEPMRKTARQQI